MKLPVNTSFFSSFLLAALLTTSSYVCAGEPVNLKKTMKEMQLQYKKAIDASSAEAFNSHMAIFKTYLHNAQGYDFSPERKNVSLEGLSKVERYIADIPAATAANLDKVKQQFAHIGELRKEYHKKSKPGIWDLLLSVLK
ncbi:MAG: cytochrome b562 [Marinobacterium sp.]|nr:cytochrome b562 [Marinobacterium sp.]